MPGKLLEDTFKAWIDRMPGGPPKLIVIGELEFPTTGWIATLRRAESQGINPTTIILELDVTNPIERAAQHVTKVHVRYDKSPPLQSYKQATIRNAGDEIAIDVGTAS